VIGLALAISNLMREQSVHLKIDKVAEEFIDKYSDHT
jgi:hypothetical protein